MSHSGFFAPPSLAHPVGAAAWHGGCQPGWLWVLHLSENTPPTTTPNLRHVTTHARRRAPTCQAAAAAAAAASQAADGVAATAPSHHNTNQESDTQNGASAAAADTALSRRQRLLLIRRLLLLLLTVPAPPPAVVGCLVLGLLDAAHLPEAVLLLLELLAAPLDLLGQASAHQPAQDGSPHRAGQDSNTQGRYIRYEHGVRQPCDAPTAGAVLCQNPAHPMFYAESALLLRANLLAGHNCMWSRNDGVRPCCC